MARGGTRDPYAGGSAKGGGLQIKQSGATQTGGASGKGYMGGASRGGGIQQKQSQPIVGGRRTTPIAIKKPRG